MSAENGQKKRIPRPSLSLTAATLTQLLAAVACFLGAFVLPISFKEFRGLNKYLLIGLGCLMLVVGLFNLFFGRYLSRFLTRAGKRSRVVVPREGVGYLGIMLVLAVGGLLGQRNMPLMIFGLMCGPFILNGAIVYRMLKGISIVRRAPRRTSAGNFVGIEIEVRNSKRRVSSHLLEVRDQIENRDGRTREPAAEGSVTFVRIPGGETRTGRYQIRFSERGRYSLGPIRVSSRFPLGIGERGQLFDVKDKVIVHPQPGVLLPSWQKREKELAESSHQSRSNVGIFDDEFHRIREYRSDDNPRSIHWRSTARRGQLMVREYEQKRQADSIVLFDFPVHPEWSGDEMEMAVSLVATICLEQSRSASGGQLLLGLTGESSQIICSRSPAGFREDALDTLAICQPSKKADLKDLLLQVVDSVPLNDERIILLTPRSQHAIETLDSLSKERPTERFDLSAHTTVLEASAEAMLDVFQLGDQRDSVRSGKRTVAITQATSPEQPPASEVVA